MNDRTAPVLLARDVAICTPGGVAILEGVDLEVATHEILGLVGESGSGKSTLGLALMAYMRPGLQRRTGTVTVNGEPTLGPTEPRSGVRGGLISYVPQDSSLALNPAIRIGEQVRGMARLHLGPEASDDDVTRALELVQLDASRSFLRRFPHQLSGGQKQRLAIAIALVGRPRVVILDEPTTGLDVVTQAALLDEVKLLRDRTGLAIVYVSHDLAVVASVADRLAVMYSGRIVEQGPAERVLSRPLHPYARGLLASTADPHRPGGAVPMPGIAVSPAGRPSGCRFAPRCAQRQAACELTVPELELVDDQRGHSVRCSEWRRTPPLAFGTRSSTTAVPTLSPLLEVRALSARYGRTGVAVLHDVSFEVGRGECVAVVGESGSGKTTLARCVGGLHAPEGGAIVLDGERLPAFARARTPDQRRRVQLIFQNPADTLNPRHTVGQIIARPLRKLAGLERRQAAERIAELLALVRLPRELAQAYPGELSGGERQRVAIARALAAEPELLICDEITSALDVSVQAAVLEVLTDLRRSLGVSLLFISHDFGAVATISDRMLIIDRGSICESGTSTDIMSGPTAAYARTLLAAVPSLSLAVGSTNAPETTPAPTAAAAELRVKS